MATMKKRRSGGRIGRSSQGKGRSKSRGRSSGHGDMGRKDERI